MTCEPSDVLDAMLILRGRVPGEHPAFDPSVAAIWHQSGIGAFNRVVVMEAAYEWDTSTGRVPTDNQFLDLCQRVQRRRAAIAAGNARPIPGQAACSECGGERSVITDDEYGRVNVRPCSLCEPKLYDRWYEGHFDSTHDRASCPDDTCKTYKGLPPALRPQAKQEEFDGLSVRDLIDKARDALGMPR